MTTVWTKISDGSTVWSQNTNGNVANIARWTTATRPASPFTGQTGLNTDFNGLEVWNGTGWLIINGSWTISARPSTLLAIGSRGFNSELGSQELWDGTNWLVA